MIINLQDTDEINKNISELQDELTANNTRLYFDYQDGKYGYNTDPSRGADTFNPFSSGGDQWELLADGLTEISSTQIAGSIFELNGNVYVFYNRALYLINLTTNTFDLLMSYPDLGFNIPTICRVKGNIYVNVSGDGLYLLNITDYSLTRKVGSHSSIHCVYTDEYIFEIGSLANSTGNYFRRYDPVANTWTNLGGTRLYVNINTNTYGSAFTYNGEVYVTEQSAVYRYDAESNGWFKFGTLKSNLYRDSYYYKYTVGNELHLIGGQNRVSGYDYNGNIDLVYDSSEEAFKYYSPAFSLPFSLYEGETYNYLLTRTENKLSLYRLKR